MIKNNSYFTAAQILAGGGGPSPAINNIYAGQDDSIVSYDLGTDTVEFDNIVDGGVVLAIDADTTNIYAALRNDFAIGKYDLSGNQVWLNTDHTSFVRGVTVDGSGNVYSCASDNTVRKMNSGGTNQWTFTDHTDDVYAVAIDSSGDVISTGLDSTVRKINASTGVQTWSYALGGRGIQVTTDDFGNSFACSLDNNNITKIDSSGNFVWNFTTTGNYARGLACDTTGNLYAVTRGQRVHKVDTSGTEVWNYSTGSDTYGVAVDSNDFVYAGYNGEIIVLDSAGVLVDTIIKSGGIFYSLVTSDLRVPVFRP